MTRSRLDRIFLQLRSYAIALVTATNTTWVSEMSKAGHRQPKGWPTVIPRIFAADVAGIVGFIKSVFGADGDMRTGAPVELRIGNAVVLVSDGGGTRDMRPAFLYVYVEDADDTYHRAVSAGAVTIEQLADMPYGDRRATVLDPWGNVWQIAEYGGDDAL